MRLRARTDRHHKEIVKARERLRAAIDRACIARGEAQWTNGYRAGAPKERDLLYEREQAQWHTVGQAEALVERAITAFARAVRNSR